VTLHAKMTTPDSQPYPIKPLSVDEVYIDYLQLFLLQENIWKLLEIQTLNLEKRQYLSYSL